MAFAKDIVGELDILQKYILYLLHAKKDEPVKGSLWLQKELFLSSKLDKELGSEADFEAYLQGPYSEEIDEALNDLRTLGFVYIDRWGPIRLSAEGSEISKLIEDELKLDIKEHLEEMKSFLNDMSEEELLAFIYGAYPEMAIHSVKFAQINKKRLPLAKQLYKKGKISLGRAAEVAGLKIEKFLESVRQ